MHCPRCGQQQVSEEIKYCSRCGFSLGLIPEILANGGFLPQLTNAEKNKKWLTRRFGLKIALLWFLFVVLILTPIAGITGAPEEVMGALGVIGVCGSLMLLALSFLFLSNEPKPLKNLNESAGETDAPQYLRGSQNRTALPPQTSQPVSSYTPPMAGSWKAPETGDLVPNSVTEGTTKLLQKDE